MIFDNSIAGTVGDHNDDDSDFSNFVEPAIAI